MRPIGNRIVIAPITGESTTKGGIIVPEMASSHLKYGKVIAVGDRAKTVGIGDTVRYKDGAGTELEWDGQKVLIVNEQELLAVA